MIWATRPLAKAGAFSLQPFTTMVRLKDIARHAGVSVMTVSKALRDQPDVSAATKVRIKSLAQQMGYVPDSSAQGLRTRTTKLFGLVIPSSTNPIFTRVVYAIEERAQELGYGILLAHTHNMPEREEVCIRRLLSRRVDGLFISPVYRFEAEARIYQEVLARQTPTVLIGPPAPFCKSFVSVEIDEQAASHAATQHLLKLGHKRIAYLTGPHTALWAHERFEGYRRALREAGLDADDKLVFQAGNTIEDGAKAAQQMLNESCGATAVQAVNDLVAIGCAQTLFAKGLRIPEDISLVGFGNITLAKYFRVPLTTIRQPKYRLGMAAVEAMMNLLQGQHVETKRLPAELVERKSTAPPRTAPHQTS
jgi:DNA-binding LacI/PurR family transcriptional regulator